MLLYVLVASIAIFQGCKINPNINIDQGLILGLVTAFILNRVMMNSFNILRNGSLKHRAVLGLIWGLILGLGTGIAFGWGGGLSGDNFLWFISFGATAFAIGSALNVMINLGY